MTTDIDRELPKPGFRERHPLLSHIPDEEFPQEVAFILDGNRRWAKKHNVPREEGHLMGVAATLKLIQEYRDSPIKRIVLWGASVANLQKRGLEEMNSISQMVGEQLDAYGNEMMDRNGRFVHLGVKDDSIVPPFLLEKFNSLEIRTAENSGQALAIAFGYEGEDEQDRVNERVIFETANLVRSNPNISDEDLLSQLPKSRIKTFYDGRGEFRNPDIILRPGAERLSGFGLEGPGTDLVRLMPWVLNPDMNSTHLDNAIIDWHRDRKPQGA